MHKVLFLVLAAVLMGGITSMVYAQSTPPVCDDDPDGDGPDTNACNCGAPTPPDPTNPPSDISGCLAIDTICLAGSVAELTGCLSLGGGGNNACAGGPDPAGLVIPCTDAQCAEASDDGCGPND